MRKDWKYILYITVAFGLFIVIKLLSPKQYDWRITYAHEDKNPYGAFALNNLLDSFFPREGIHHSYKTLYEIKDSLEPQSNILIVSTNFNGAEEDTNVLLKHVGGGATAFISAQYFQGHFADTLDISTYDYFFKGQDIFSKKDTVALKFTNPSLDTAKGFFYRRDNIHNYFSHFDTTRTMVIARNERHMPVTIRVKWGDGNFILNCTPLVFSNIYLLSGNNDEFVSTLFSYLPHTAIEWTEYYHLGRMEVSTPLRFILMNETLRWAYYIIIISILLFMIFELKRKQRIIPVIKPLANTTLEFVTTIGNLYYQRSEHKNIAEKKIHFLTDQIRIKHWLNTSKLDEHFVQALARKTGKAETEVDDLVRSIVSIQAKDRISAGELIDFNKKIEKFNE